MVAAETHGPPAPKRQRLNNGKLLPHPEKRRAELVVTFACGACGRVQATHDLNDSSLLRDHVQAGRAIPSDALDALRSHFAGAPRSETCPCGATTRFEAAADGHALHGLKGRDVTRPIVDGARFDHGKLVLVGRFLSGATVQVHRGQLPGEKAAAHYPPHAPRALKVTEARRSIVDTSKHERHVGKTLAEGVVHEVELDLEAAHLPAAGAVMVVSATNEHGTTSVSVVVEGDGRGPGLSPTADPEKEKRHP